MEVVETADVDVDVEDETQTVAAVVAYWHFVVVAAAQML